ncbi:hypothetical protein BGW80DRAFT_1445183, partial [Lactifluus volemus]
MRQFSLTQPSSRFPHNSYRGNWRSGGSKVLQVNSSNSTRFLNNNFSSPLNHRIRWPKFNSNLNKSITPKELCLPLHTKMLCPSSLLTMAKVIGVICIPLVGTLLYKVDPVISMPLTMTRDSTTSLHPVIMYSYIWITMQGLFNASQHRQKMLSLNFTTLTIVSTPIRILLPVSPKQPHLIHWFTMPPCRRGSASGPICFTWNRALLVASGF